MKNETTLRQQQAKKLYKFWTNGKKKELYKYIHLYSQRAFLTNVINHFTVSEFNMYHALQGYKYDNNLKVVVKINDDDACQVLGIPEVQKFLLKYGFSVKSEYGPRVVTFWEDAPKVTYTSEWRFKYFIFPYKAKIENTSHGYRSHNETVEDTTYEVTFIGVPVKPKTVKRKKRSRK